MLSTSIDRLRKLGGVVLAAPSGRGRLVLDGQCRLMHFASEDDDGDEGALERFVRAVERIRSEEPAEGSEATTEVRWVCADREGADLGERVERLVEIVDPDGEVRVTFVDPRRDERAWWRRAGEVLEQVANPLGRAWPGRVRFALETRIDSALPERVADVLARTGLQVRHLCLDPTSELDSDACAALLETTRTGLRVPVVFYVAANSADAVRDAIPRAVQASQYSGVVLRPWVDGAEIEHDHGLEPVAAEEFAGLVRDVYVDFPYFDDVMEPTAQVAEALGKRPQRDVRRWLVDADGSFGEYVKLPARARRRGSGEAADGGPPTHAACFGCQWRPTCGGMDPVESEDTFRTVCWSWQLTAELLLWDRARLAGIVPASGRPEGASQDGASAQ